MYQDEIIREVRENRGKFSDRHNHDIDAMIEELMADQGKTTGSVVDRRRSLGKAVRFGLSAVSGKWGEGGPDENGASGVSVLQ